METHAQLIDETEGMVDRTDERLRQARKKLDYVGRRVKDNSKCIIHCDVIISNGLHAMEKNLFVLL